MGFMYWLFNLLIPLILLIYTSITTFKHSNTLSYGKWAFMIIIIHLMSWVSWIFDDYYSVFFIDLAIKLAIPFLPQNISTLIQSRISNLHFQVHINKLRQYLFHSISQLYIKLTDYLLYQMNLTQSQQFKSTIMQHFNTTIKDQKTITFYDKISSTKVNYDHLTKSYVQTSPNYQTANNQEQIPNNNLFSQQQKQKQKGMTFNPLVSKELIDKQYQRQQYNDENQQQYPRFSYSTKNNSIIKETPSQSQNINYQTPVQQSYSQYKNIATDSRYQNIPLQENRFTKSQTKSIYTQLSSPTNQYQPPYGQSQPQFSQYQRTYSQYQPMRSQFHKHSEPANHQQMYPHILINQTQQKLLKAKVQVILEIGTGSSARLQIYYLELYSNNDLRILSLYEREFQSHKLHSMKPLPHGYYQLLFEGGKIHSRKCKFRQGNFEPFLKFLN